MIDEKAILDLIVAINGQQNNVENVIAQVGKLTDSVDRLVIADRERIIADKRQDEINKDIKEEMVTVKKTITDFTKEYEPDLILSRRWAKLKLTVYTVVVASAIIGALSMFYQLSSAETQAVEIKTEG